MAANHQRLARLEAALEGHRGFRVPGGDRLRSAAVAAVVRPVAADLSLLLIRRPLREGDRWSGNLAFPGGLQRDGDGGLAATARREAFEEVGLSLDSPLGRLSDLLTATPGQARPMRVVPLVFIAPEGATVRPDPREVAEAFWVRWSWLLGAPRQRHWRRIGPVPVPVRGVVTRGHLLWGLTYAMTRELLRLG